MGTFVTVGNAHQRFGRLLNAVEQIAEKLPQPVLVQCGHTPFNSEKCTAVDFMAMDRFLSELSNADLVITHGGATVMQAIQLGKIPVVFPRRAEFGEHIDNHQVHFAAALAHEGAAELAAGAEHLEAAVSKAMTRIQHRVLRNPPLVQEVAAVVERVAGVVCPVCGRAAQPRRVASLPSCAVYRCSACSAQFSDLQPSERELAAAYENFNAGEMSRNEFEQYRAHARTMLSRLVGKGEGRRFLDYGCGGGHFVAAAMDLGFQAVGMEFDRVSVTSGTARGLDIRQVRTSAGEVPAGEMFDVIFVFHVLEHMSTPRRMVAALREHLRPGGALIIGVPDQDSFPAILKRFLRAVGIKRSEYGFVQPPIHVIGFNKRSLQALGDGFGLDCLRLSRQNAIDPDNFPVGSAYWGNMPIHKTIYAVGAAVGSGGHLIATFCAR